MPDGDDLSSSDLSNDSRDAIVFWFGLSRRVHTRSSARIATSRTFCRIILLIIHQSSAIAHPHRDSQRLQTASKVDQRSHGVSTSYRRYSLRPMSPGAGAEGRQSRSERRWRGQRCRLVDGCAVRWFEPHPTSSMPDRGHKRRDGAGAVDSKDVSFVRSGFRGTGLRITQTANQSRPQRAALSPARSSASNQRLRTPRSAIPYP